MVAYMELAWVAVPASLPRQAEVVPIPMLLPASSLPSALQLVVNTLACARASSAAFGRRCCSTRLPCSGCIAFAHLLAFRTARRQNAGRP